MHLGKDWTLALMLQSYLILYLKVFKEEESKIAFEGLQISIITVHCGYSALDFKFNLKL